MFAARLSSYIPDPSNKSVCKTLRPFWALRIQHSSAPKVWGYGSSDRISNATCFQLDDSLHPWLFSAIIYRDCLRISELNICYDRSDDGSVLKLLRLATVCNRSRWFLWQVVQGLAPVNYHAHCTGWKLFSKVKRSSPLGGIRSMVRQ